MATDDLLFSISDFRFDYEIIVTSSETM